jgi:hypothetical protein
MKLLLIVIVYFLTTEHGTNFALINDRNITIGINSNVNGCENIIIGHNCNIKGSNGLIIGFDIDSDSSNNVDIGTKNGKTIFHGEIYFNYYEDVSEKKLKMVSFLDIINKITDINERLTNVEYFPGGIKYEEAKSSFCSIVEGLKAEGLKAEGLKADSSNQLLNQDGFSKEKPSNDIINENSQSNYLELSQEIKVLKKENTEIKNRIEVIESILKSIIDSK